ncbi:hypothetical protein HUG10_21310 (plasmid) [Halorarum halophilum]|uniref:Uncharacterized protein n=1 Tax=Halorarum halophilum TaxID=2743090 RepID=A0A7D5GHY2_9EURY|nr:hypothetical protein [Halobaculum halophilum]QLG30128.1 hypothetical protein HUG10_21310 [Halobaculum halophilum]
MHLDDYLVNTMVIRPRSFDLRTHYQLLEFGRAHHEGTVTVVGLAS